MKNEKIKEWLNKLQFVLCRIENDETREVLRQVIEELHHMS